MLQIVTDTRLSTHLSLYDVFCFDLADQMLDLKGLVQEKDLYMLLNQFRMKWFTLRNQNQKDPTGLLKCLEDLIPSFLNSVHHRNAPQGNSTTDTLKQQRQLDERNLLDGQHIKKVLAGRADLLRKFLQSPGAMSFFLDYPLYFYQGFEVIEQYFQHKTSKPFERMSCFLTFVFTTALLSDASLKDPLEKLEELQNYLNSIVTFQKNEKDHPIFIAEFKNWLNGRTPGLLQVLQAILYGYADHLKMLNVNHQDIFDDKRGARILIGDVPHFQEYTDHRGHTDKLSFFRAQGGIPSSFSLTAAEEQLLDTLFENYPLDSDLTLLDLFAFALG